MRFVSTSDARHPSRAPASCSTPKTSCSPGLPYVSRQSSSAVWGLAATLGPGSDFFSSKPAGRGREGEAGECGPEHDEHERRAAAHRRHARTPRAGRLARALDLYEYQGKELFRRYGIPVSEGRLATTPGRGTRSGAGARLPGGRQGAGAHRRAWQGGRHQARREPGGGGGAGVARSSAWTSAATGCIKRLDRARLGHRARVLPVDHVRPRREEAALHVHDPGRYRHRGGGGIEPRRTRPAPRRPARGVPPVAGPAPRLPGRGGGARQSRSRSRPSPASSTRPSSAARRCSARSTR